MGKILLESEVKTTTGATESTTANLCCTYARALALHAYVTGSPANNQLIDNAAKRTVSSTASETQNASVGSSYSAGNIAAGGGSSRAYADVSYQARIKTTYNNGEITYSSWVNTSSRIYGPYVTATTKGTTVSNVTNVGYSTPSGTVAGATRTGTTVTIQQNANSKSDTYGYQNVAIGGVWEGPSNDDIPASGGSRYGVAWGSWQQRTISSYSSGTTTYSNWTNNTSAVYGTTVSANSKGNTVSGRTQIGYSTVTFAKGGAFRYGSTLIYQATNVVVSESYNISNVKIGSSYSAGDIAADGGSSKAYAYVSYTCTAVALYSSNVTSVISYGNATTTIWGPDVSATKNRSENRIFAGYSRPVGAIQHDTVVRYGTTVSIYQSANTAKTTSGVITVTVSGWPSTSGLSTYAQNAWSINYDVDYSNGYDHANYGAYSGSSTTAVRTRPNKFYFQYTVKWYNGDPVPTTTVSITGNMDSACGQGVVRYFETYDSITPGSSHTYNVSWSAGIYFYGEAGWDDVITAYSNTVSWHPTDSTTVTRRIKGDYTYIGYTYGNSTASCLSTTTIHSTSPSYTFASSYKYVLFKYKRIWQSGDDGSSSSQSVYNETSGDSTNGFQFGDF